MPRYAVVHTGHEVVQMGNLRNVHGYRSQPAPLSGLAIFDYPTPSAHAAFALRDYMRSQWPQSSFHVAEFPDHYTDQEVATRVRHQERYGHHRTVVDDDEELETCYSCDATLPTGYSYTGPDGFEYCEDCAEWTDCYACGESTWYDDANYGPDPDYAYCDWCYRQNFDTCDDCNEVTNTDDLTCRSGDNLCLDCCESSHPPVQLRTCNGCGSHNHHMDALTECFICDCEAQALIDARKPVVLARPLSIKELVAA